MTEPEKWAVEMPIGVVGAVGWVGDGAGGERAVDLDHGGAGVGDVEAVERGAVGDRLTFAEVGGTVGAEQGAGGGVLGEVAGVDGEDVAGGARLVGHDAEAENRVERGSESAADEPLHFSARDIIPPDEIDVVIGGDGHRSSPS